MKAWNIGFAAAHVPKKAEISALLPLTDPRTIELNNANFSVFLPQKGMALDLGAIAKGFIADRVKTFLQNSKISSALINLGGNIHSLGVPPMASPVAGNNSFWTIGLQKPFAKKGVLLGLMHIADKSVVTSGIYERYFIIEGDDNQNNVAGTAGSPTDIWANSATMAGFYHHIFNPHTGCPLHNDLMSVTIISEYSIDGEIWSSLLYGMGATAGAEMFQRANIAKAVLQDKSALPSPNGPENCNACVLPKGLTGVFITKDRRIILPAHNDLQFTLLDKTYRLCFS